MGSDRQRRRLLDCPDQKQLRAFCLGKATAVPWDVLAEHVPNCPACSAELAAVGDESDIVIAHLRLLAPPASFAREPEGSGADGSYIGIAHPRPPTRQGSIAQEPGGSGVGLPGTVEHSPTPLSSPAGAPETQALPARVGCYQLLQEIGHGGMGIVYRARHTALNRTVALKLISGGTYIHPEVLARFRIEGEAIARLKHPNVVEVYDSNIHDGRPYLAMELVEGQTLAKRLARGPLGEREAAELVSQLASAVETAHERRILHRDLKPSNVLLTFHGVPKLADFGLAKLLDVEDGQTQSDAVLGTASYMAPEQAEGRSKDIGPHSDVYALGAILYEALAGRPPFRGETRLETLEAVRLKEPLPPSTLRRGVSPDLEAVCLKCLQKAPRARYASAEGLAQDLERWLRGEPTVARPRGWLGRSWGKVRRHPVLCSLAASLLVLASASVAVVPYIDPERPLRQNQARLDQGQDVTLVGETGKPAWFRWRNGEDKSQISVESDGTFAIHTWSLCLLELLPDPRHDSYRVSASVRHRLSSQNSAEVGLYFAHHSQPGPRGEMHLFLEMIYNDVNSNRDRPRPTTRPLPEESFVDFRPYFYGEVDDHWTWNRNMAGKHAPKFLPAGYPGERWRNLEILVTSDKVQGFWDGAPTGELSIAWLGEEIQKDFTRARALRPDDSFLARMPSELRLRGGLGLYVRHGSACFRNVSITPLNGSGAVAPSLEE
jgi:serine/threonine-protein kinase